MSRLKIEKTKQILQKIRIMMKEKMLSSPSHLIKIENEIH